LHFQYAKRQLDRAAQQQAAGKLLWAGSLVFLVLVGSIGALMVAAAPATGVAKFHLLAVLFFGAVGAFISRVTSFQSAIATFDYEAGARDYSAWGIVVRLMIGALMAMVLYLLLAGSFLSGGHLLPASVISDTWLTPVGTDAIFVPNAEFAKLLVWSLLAGFSERLIPDRLTEISKSLQTAPDRKP